LPCAPRATCLRSAFAIGHLRHCDCCSSRPLPPGTTRLLGSVRKGLRLRAFIHERSALIQKTNCTIAGSRQQDLTWRSERLS
jgi:hypothetical protein